jgi:hypothetical protein
MTRNASDNLPRSIWLDALNWMQEMEARLLARYPRELPPGETPDFWMQVARLEMTTRSTLSAKLGTLLDGKESLAMTDLDAWMYRRRVEWAAQLALASAQQSADPDCLLPDVLRWLLIESWESDGCVALWNHAERGGPHPENPDGLSPMPGT